jgi:hypothetical protein
MGSNEHYARLIEALRLLAAPSSEQRAALPPYVHIPEELALIFEDCALLADPEMGQIRLNDHEREWVQRVRDALARMDEDPACSFSVGAQVSTTGVPSTQALREEEASGASWSS